MTCYYPMTLRAHREDELTVPCGRCIGCRLERSRQWAVRCDNERQMHDDNAFVTLTYRDEELIYGSQLPTLYPKHLQLFFKRLRKVYGKCRYFACGEYGGRTNRPHYHACVFGLDFPDKKFHKVTETGDKLYTSSGLDDVWGHGNCVIGDVTFESAAYVARYIMAKKLGGTAHHYDLLGVEPEFVRMSRKPGIGSTWFDKYQSDVFPGDMQVVRGGVISKPPRYYLDKYKLTNPDKVRSIKLDRAEMAAVKYRDNMYGRLRVREEVKKAATRSLARDL